MNDIPAGPGDNLPPVDADPIRDRLVEKYAELEERKNKLLAGAARVPPIEDADTAQRVTDFIKQLQGFDKQAEALRVAEKEPFLMGSRAVDGFFKGHTGPVKQAHKDVSANLQSYLRRVEEEARQVAEEKARVERERERQEREAAERQAREASDEVALQLAVEAEARAKQAAADAVVADREARAKPAEFSRTRGDLGGVSSLKQFWDFRIVTREHIDLEALRPYISPEDIEKAIRRYVATNKGDVPLPGVEIFQNTKVATR